MSQHSEDQAITERYRQKVLPFWQNQVVTGTLASKDDIAIAYAYVVHPQPKGSIAISSGRIEALIKYKELVFDLYQAGYSVFIHDHRGQGASGRMTDRHQLGYVADFADYVEDFKLFYDSIIMPQSTTQPFLLCHSMGSAIGALYLLQYPGDFKKAIFSAPMFGIRPVMPAWLSSTLVGSHLFLSRLISPLPRYFFGQGDYQSVAFEQNVLTHSRARYEIFRQEYEQSPEVKLGGVTSHWLRAALDAMNYIEQHAQQIQLPVLHLQAEADKVVENGRQSKVCQCIPNCESVVLVNSMHEILMEDDSIRGACLDKILDFLDQDD